MGYQGLGPARPVHHRGRPATPIVPIERVRPKAPEPDPEPEPPAPPVERDWLRLASPEERSRFYRPRRVLEVLAPIAAAHSVNVVEMLGPRRRGALLRARRAAIAALAQAFPHWSLLQLGQAMNRDHTTILHHLKKAGLR
jgi:hypothetical protein